MSGSLVPNRFMRGPALKLGALGLALAALTTVAPLLQQRLDAWALALCFTLGALGILFALRVSGGAPERESVIVILAFAVLMRLALLFVEPYLSTDIYRYVWDGRVQAAGINPYRYVPAASEIAHLRDAAIYPNINRADYAVTIYPPVAQAIFLAITRLGESVVAMKLGLLCFDAAVIAAILGLLRRLGASPTRVVAYAWHPLPIWEVAGNGHVDIAMCALLMAGMLLFLGKRSLLAGIAVTLGALVKPTALLALPVLWKPWGLRLPFVVALTLVLAYLPYLSVGSGVFGFLWGYVVEEGLTSGRGINVLWLLERVTGHVPAAATLYVAVAALIMGATALAVSFRQDRSAATSLECLSWLLVTFLILASPHYPWYFLVLVPLLALRPSATAWCLSLTCPLLYDSAPGTGWPTYDTRIALLVVAALAALAYDARTLWRKAHTLAPGEAR